MKTIETQCNRNTKCSSNISYLFQDNSSTALQNNCANLYTLRWQLAVWSQSTQLLYPTPDYYWDRYLVAGEYTITSQISQLSLAIPPWAGTISTPWFAA